MSEQRRFEKVAYQFTDTELNEMGRFLARVEARLADAEAQKAALTKEITGNIAVIKREIRELTVRIETGIEMRDVEVLILMDTPTPGVKRIVRLDTNQPLREEVMTREELQQSFGFKE